MPLSLPNKDKKKKKIDEVEERLSPKKVSDLSFSEARAIREQYGSLKNYELATDKNRAKRIDEQMQDLNARRLVDAATSRGTPVEAESYGKNNKWNDYTTVMSERKSDYDRAVEKLKKDLDVYSPIADVSGVKNYLDATKAGYDNAVALGKSAADFGNAFKSADDFKRWSIGWDESRTGDESFVDNAETRQKRKNYYEGLKQKRDELEAKKAEKEQELYDFHQSDAYKNANYGSPEERENINTETTIKAEAAQYNDEIERLNAELNRYERFTEVQDKYHALTENPNFGKYSLHSGSGRSGDGEQVSNDNTLDKYMKVYSMGGDAGVKANEAASLAGGSQISSDERGVWEKYKSYNLELLTEEEKQIYNYLLSAQGIDAANQYLDEMKMILNRRNEQKENEYLQSLNGWDLAGANILSVPLNIAGGVSSFASDALNTLAGNDINPYDSAHRAQTWASTIRGETAQRINNATGNANLLGFSLGDTYQALMSAADSAAGAALFGRAYTITMGAGAASSRAKELYENGASNNQILMSALASGLTEVVTEYVSVDKLVSNFLESTPKNKLDLILKMLSQGGIEASEEFAADILNTIQDNAILRSQSEWNKKLKEYMDGGMSREEAQQKVWFDTMGDALKSAAGGFVSGIAMGGPALVSNAVGKSRETRSEGKAIRNADTTSSVLNMGKELVGDITDAKAKESLQNAIESVEKKPTNKTVGNLSRAISEAINTVADEDTREALNIKYGAARVLGLDTRENTKLYNNADVTDKVSDTGSAVNTETGENIEISETNPIAKVENGEVYLNTDKGEVKQSEVKYSTEQQAKLLENVSDLPTAVANAIVKNYSGQQNVEQYVSAMREGILHYGYNNVTAENVPQSTAFKSLSAEDQQYALAQGRALAAEDIKAAEAKVANLPSQLKRTAAADEVVYKAEKAPGASGTGGVVWTKGDVNFDTDVNKSNAAGARVVAAAFGKNIVLYDSKTVNDSTLKNANGKYVGSDGTIYLDINGNSDGGMMYTLSHEMTHEAEKWARREYRAFADFLIQNYAKKGVTVKELIDRKMMELNTEDEDLAYSEVIADAAENMLLDSDALDKLTELVEKHGADKGWVEKLKSWIKTALDWIRSAYEHVSGASSREANEVAEFGKAVEKLQDLWSKAVVAAAENRAAAVGDKTTESGEVSEQFQKKVPEDQLSLWDDEGNLVGVETESEVVKELVSLTEEIVKKARHGGWTGHEVDEFYAKHKEYDFVQRFFDGDKSAKSDLQKLVSQIDDVFLLSDMAWYTTQNHFTIDHKYRGAITKVRNIYQARINEIQAQKANGTEVKLEKREYKLREMWDLFQQLNRNDDIAELASKVFDKASKIGVTVAASNKFLGRYSQNPGVNVGKTIWLKQSAFADPTITDQFKASTIVHELIHACTTYALSDEYINDKTYSDPDMVEAAKSLRRIYNQALTEPSLEGSYGLKSEHEFVAELSNPVFREKLQKVNLWDRIVNAIKRLFGIETNGKQTSMLDAASAALDYMLDSIDYDGVNSYAMLQEDAMRQWERRNNQDRYQQKKSTSMSIRAIVDRAMETLDKGSAEYNMVSKYKTELDKLDTMRAELDEAIKSGDKQAETKLRNNIKTQNGILTRIENSNVTRNVTALKDVAKLTKDVKNLREMLRLQAKETGGTIASKTSAEAVAKELMDKYGVKRGKGELAGIISRLYTELISGVNDRVLNVEYMRDLSRDAAEWIAEHQAKEYEGDDAAQEVLDYLKGKKVWLNDQQKGDIRHKYDGQLNKWMGRLSGYVTVTNDKSAMPLDDLWNDLSKQFPAEFGEVSDADQGWMLADKLSDLKERANHELVNHGLTDEQMEEWTDQVTDAVYESLWNIKPMETVADKYEKQITELKEKHRADMSALRKSFADTIREERSTMYAEAKERAREYGERLELRRKVRKIKADLTEKLGKPTAKKFIPADLRAATSAMLTALNNDNENYSQNTRDRIAKLQAIYDSYKDENIAYDEQVSEWLSELRETVGSKTISELTKGELESVYKVLRAFSKNISDVAKVKSLYAAGVSTDKTVDVVAKEWMRNIKKVNPALAAYFNTTGQLLGRPELVFRIFGNMDRNSIPTKVYDMLNAAQREYNRIRIEGNKLFEEMFDSKEGKKYLADIHDTKQLYDIGLKDADGKPIKVTKDFALWLNRILLNENAIRHVATTGGIMPDFKQYYEGGDAYGKKSTRAVGVLNRTATVQDGGKWASSKANDILDDVKLRAAEIDTQIEEAQTKNDFDKVKELRKEQDKVWAVWSQVETEGRQILLDTVQKNIEKIITPQDQKFLDLAAKFYDEWSKNYMNKASNERFGIDIADEENYTRIHTADNFRKAKLDKANMESAIGTENMGFTKRRVGATNPIYFEGLSTAISKHIDEVATYAAYLNPLCDLRKILDFTEGGIEQTSNVKRALTEKFGKAAVKYIYRLAANVKGQSTSELGDIEWVDRLFNKLLGRTAEAALAANGRVIAYQMVSALNAAAELGYGRIAATFLTKPFKKAPTDLIAKYTPVYEVRRSNGSTDEVANMKNAAKNRGVWYAITYPGTHAIQAMDLWTVGRLWFASESYVKKHNKNLKPGTVEFYKAVGKKFTDVVELTQPNYTPMQRNQLQRSKNPLARALTMFKTQPFQNLNNAIGASFQFAHDIAGLKNGTTTKAEARESGAKLYRTATSLVASAAMMAVINAVWNALVLHGHWRWKDDETGEFSWEKFGDWTLDEALGRFFSNDPLAGEAYSFIGSKIFDRKYYPGFSMPQVEVVTDALETLSDSTDKIIAGEWNAKKEGREMASKIGRLFGLPVDSIVKPIEGIYLNVQDIINGEFGTFNAGYEYKDAQLATQMLNALEDGNTEKYDKARGVFKPTKTQTADQVANSALTKAIKASYMIGETDKETAEEWLAEYCGKDSKEIYTTLEKWNLEKEGGEKGDYKVYDKFAEAVRTGKDLKAVIKEYKDVGYTEDNLNDAIRNSFKAGYIAASNAERAKLKGYLLNAYVAVGYDKEKYKNDDAYREKKSDDIDKWVED